MFLRAYYKRPNIITVELMSKYNYPPTATLNKNIFMLSKNRFSLLKHDVRLNAMWCSPNRTLDT